MTQQSADLLDWYDIHAREMPWRVGPAARQDGVRPDPYHIWLSEVMLQQTTVAAVKDYFRKFVSRWPTVRDLAGAQDGDVMAAWAGLGYYARARNLLKCARVVAQEHGGVFPDTYDALLKLPGIGPYTAAAVSAIAFDRRAVVLDGNVERVMARYYRVLDPLPASKETLRTLADGLTPNRRCGDYAQAVMDLGATICTPRSPACGICPWMADCAARLAGDAASLPRKTPKAAKPIRLGVAYVAERTDGAVLLERRPDKGLLGGMLGWPGSTWQEAPHDAEPPLDADWQDRGEVRHTFTHFHLRLQVRFARDVSGDPDSGSFLPRTQFSPADLPTVMRKAWDLCR
ncbi:A/G-specific adenine glycosylase [Neptunicoccus cionae]|uniref:A/G-specific adenine glycosylase n=1 Tax=Neptunicoccus cionae TaxID=2035344 RepID=UPI000C7836EF|nr:A/G-specific adenine glycosylase [Amylibacter cionae]PLS22899.1 A/G-specific adenine glycosylase [Amylibacter cionae]